MPSNKANRIKPSDVAADTKKRLIPEVNKHFRSQWPPFSYLYSQPLADLDLPQAPYISSEYPAFYVAVGDPVDCAISWAESESKNGTMVRIPFICAANERRPGGDWETGVVGYEERLCRRSNLSSTLSTPGPESYEKSNYPIPIEGAIFSANVVIFREIQDRIESLPVNQWNALPVVSMPPTRWPKLTHGGTKYSFIEERDLVRNKMRAALRICVYNGAHQIVIGDFGLGNGYRNPPIEMAELWREVFLYDPDLRGQFSTVMFAFEDPRQSTTRYILDDIAKKSKGDSGSRSKSKSSSSSASSSSSSSTAPSDFDIFSHVFSREEVHRLRSRPDPRYGLGMITSPS